MMLYRMLSFFGVSNVEIKHLDSVVDYHNGSIILTPVKMAVMTLTKEVSLIKIEYLKNSVYFTLNNNEKKLLLEMRRKKGKSEYFYKEHQKEKRRDPTKYAPCGALQCPLVVIRFCWAVPFYPRTC